VDTRFPRSLVRRVEATDLPLSALEAVRELREYLEAVEQDRIVRARALGASPTDIARALGITRQAVHNRLNALLRRDAEMVDLSRGPNCTQP